MSGAGTDHAALGRWQAVELVSWREITTRLRSKAFRIATAIAVVILIALAVSVHLIGGLGGYTVAVPRQQAAIAPALRLTGEAIGQKVRTRVVPDAAAGRRLVRAGTVDAVLTPASNGLHVVVDRNLDTGLKNAMEVLAQRVVLDQQIERLGGNPARVDSAVAAASVHVESLRPPHRYKTQQLVLGIVAGILIYISLLSNGQSVAQGVVEEKSSRVVELLLSTIRPWQLMLGKVIGIGVVGLIQIAVIGVVGIGASLATGALTISVSAATGTVLWLIAWYLLGFFSYALALAAVGALVSRQEDVGGVVAPVLMFLIIGYVLGISVLPSNPGSRLVEILSLIPVFAPTLMPMRLAMGGVPAWEAALSVLLVLALIPGLVWLSGRIYRNAVVRTGARVRFKDALRAAR